MAADTFANVEPAGEAPEQIVQAYRTAFQTVLDRVDATQLEADTGLTVEGVRDEIDRTALTDVSAVLAVADGAQPDQIHAELLDQLLIEMTTAVVDVDALAGRTQVDLSGKELQQRIEGRAPMTLREYALIRHAIRASA